MGAGRRHDDDCLDLPIIEQIMLISVGLHTAHPTDKIFTCGLQTIRHCDQARVFDLLGDKVAVKAAHAYQSNDTYSELCHDKSFISGYWF